jgi:hypothetical protein
LPPGAEADPRTARAQAACDRLEAELRDAPDSVRAFLGDPAATVEALRRSCKNLLEREQALRAESAPEVLARLEEEREKLAARIEKESDEPILLALRGAVAAIDEQKRQRDQLRKSADRLEAEQTRLLYTLEGMAAQFVRLRTAGVEARLGPTGELERSGVQLKGEIEAIADALEEVSRPAGPAMERIAEISESPDTGSALAMKVRE